MKLKYLLNITVLLLIVFAGINCEEKPTEPPVEEFPPGYQHDIPWLSLADSPWPMYRADPQNTGRSKLSPLLIGEYFNLKDSLFLRSGLAINKDSIMFITSTNFKYGLFSINNNFQIDMVYPFSQIYSFEATLTPLVSSPDVVYTSSFTDKRISAVNSSGNIIWEIPNFEIRTSGINIDKQGNLYVIKGYNTLVVISKVGEILWELNNLNIYSGEYSQPAFSPEGDALYFHGPTGNSIVAIDVISKTIKWKYSSGSSITNPIVDVEGNIYTAILENNIVNLHSINKNGINNWILNLNETFITDFSIDKNGNIIIGYKTLYSISNNGVINWEKELNDNEIIASPIVTDAVNNIYLVKYSNGKPIFIKMNSLGNIVFALELSEELRLGVTPIVAFNKILIPSYRSNIIVIVK